jgi:hypothetical protein
MAKAAGMGKAAQDRLPTGSRHCSRWSSVDDLTVDLANVRQILVDEGESRLAACAPARRIPTRTICGRSSI